MCTSGSWRAAMAPASRTDADTRAGAGRPWGYCAGGGRAAEARPVGGECERPDAYLLAAQPAPAVGQHRAVGRHRDSLPWHPAENAALGERRVGDGGGRDDRNTLRAGAGTTDQYAAAAMAARCGVGEPAGGSDSHCDRGAGDRTSAGGCRESYTIYAVRRTPASALSAGRTVRRSQCSSGRAGCCRTFLALRAARG